MDECLGCDFFIVSDDGGCYCCLMDAMVEGHRDCEGRADGDWEED